LDTKNTGNQRTTEATQEKKPYKTPNLRFENVFEVSALSCGKLTASQSSCNLNTKTS
jgi:hypothetical protein